MTEKTDRQIQSLVRELERAEKRGEQERANLIRAELSARGAKGKAPARRAERRVTKARERRG